MFAQQLINGLTIGCVYALIAVGYSMVYGILRIVNFAHGDIFMMGAFFGLILTQAMGVSVLITFPLACLCTAVLGMAIERFAYRPIWGGGNTSRMAALICAMGVSIMLQSLAQLIFGTETHPFSGTDIQLVTYNFGSVTVTNLQFIMLGLTVALMVALLLLVYKTKFGVAMRATSNSLNTARLLGINTNLIISVTFAIGSILACASGLMVGVYFDAVFPTMGYSYGIKAFAAAVLGGIGSLPGAMVGGLTIGLIESLGAAYISSGYRNAFAFGIMIIVLIFRPGGIFGKATREKV